MPASETFMPTRWLADGDAVHVGQSTLSERHCPGHMPGHVVFRSAEANRAFVGDVLFAGSIGRTDFPGGDFDTLIRSITERLWPMGNDTLFIPGHGPESTFGRARRANPYVKGTRAGSTGRHLIPLPDAAPGQTSATCGQRKFCGGATGRTQIPSSARSR